MSVIDTGQLQEFNDCYQQLQQRTYYIVKSTTFKDKCDQNLYIYIDTFTYGIFLSLNIKKITVMYS